MSDIAIKVENLSKRYRIGLKEELPETFLGAMTGWLRSPLANLRDLRKLSHFSDNGHTPDDVIYALKDVSFEVKHGEVVGIIGRNGAGKSTLLKILSRITEPSSGRAVINGRVASLLEVGTGFHPELTGRENVYLNGTILGMTKAEVERKFDEIVDFSGVEKFIDTPVKRYSSGMKVRLAFAVAAHLEPEILVIDEVLAVGDADFQKKCLGKMGEVASEGRTVLFVSHNMAAVSRLCKRTILLADGTVLADGESDQIVGQYLAHGSNREEEVAWEDINSAPGSESVKLHAVRICRNGIPSSQIDIDRAAEIEIEFWNRIPGQKLVPSIKLLDEEGTVVFQAINLPQADLNKENLGLKPLDEGLYRTVCSIPPNFLNDRHYFVTIVIASTPPPTREVYIENIISFSVQDTGAMRAPHFNGKWLGVIRTPFYWNTEKLTELQAEHKVI
ncbi:MAG: ABC transporter ATP-binding protein [Anaerolineae bacterium]|nr:ABC transporter ATP-binding protein [Anaerolineae bacterium]